MITDTQLNNIRQWFRAYTAEFVSDIYDINKTLELKKLHTINVCTNILMLGEKAGLDQQQLKIAEIIALLHDIGRFEQLERYKTLIDRDSVDHACLGVEILTKNGWLNELGDEAEVIKKSILYHNRISLPAKESEEVLLFTRLIRDADKIDIMGLNIDHFNRREKAKNFALELNLSAGDEVTIKVVEGILDGSTIRSDELKTLNDFKLIMMGWVFDINFRLTFEIINKRNYLERIMETLPKHGMVFELFEKCNKFVEKKLNSEY